MFNVTILGAGWIARKMCQALAPLADYQVYAVASRSLERAQAFADEFAIPRAYDDYAAACADPQTDLVYIATPHSHHYQHARMALMAGKPVLVEKAFAANAAQAEELIRLAEEKHVFITEAIWTRYMPLSHKIGQLVRDNAVGNAKLLTATLSYEMSHKERILKPELCGGALLDLGVYCLNFARMYFGTDIVRMVSNCHLGETGVDMQEAISLSFRDGRMANLQAGALALNDRQGIISGPEGYIRVDNINCPTRVEVWRNYELAEVYEAPEDMVNGYEYQVMECARCIREGLLESPMMPHHETIAIMRQMDQLRREWGVHYPMDDAPLD